jgi:hypothetical protein
LTDSFFEGVEEFVEFEELFVHVDGFVLELLDFFGAFGENEGQGRIGRRWRKLRGTFFAVEDVVDVDADGFEFFAEDVANAVFTGDVGGDIGGVFGSDGLAECYLGFKLLFDFCSEAFGFVGVRSWYRHIFIFYSIFCVHLTDNYT